VGEFCGRKDGLKDRPTVLGGGGSGKVWVASRRGRLRDRRWRRLLRAM